MAARRLRPDERLLDLRPAEGVEGYELHTRHADEAPDRKVLTDVPPARFVDRWNDAHGEVRVAPLVDQMLARLRRHRAGDGDDGADGAEGPAGADPEGAADPKTA